MYFQHDAALWRDFPDLVPGVLYAAGITADAAPDTDPAGTANTWTATPQTAVLTSASPRITPALKSVST